MTDRELLELAAKAAELPECGWMGPAFMYVKDNQFKDWNPLEDDGDALQLAVKLGIDIELQVESVWANGLEVQNYQLFEWHKGDRCAATRRAIVRAAAEIGKGMK
jgi:hypothetical protein